MQQRRLGTSRLEVSAVALGCMSLCANNTYEDITPEQATATINAAIDAGVTLFDTAPAYGGGESERRVGAALSGGKRDRVLIATKISSTTLTSADISRELDASLARLQTDHVDLYQIHWPRRATPIDETLRSLEDVVAAGKVRAIGVCNFGPIDLAGALEHASLASDQMSYSLLGRAPEFDAVSLCQQHNVGLLCYSPLAQGLLTGRFTSAEDVPAERARTRHFARTRSQTRHDEAGAEALTFRTLADLRDIAADLGLQLADLAIAWLLHQPTVASVLAGASRPEQIARNAKAAEIRLSKQSLDRLDAATADLKLALGENCDPWQSASRIQ